MSQEVDIGDKKVICDCVSDQGNPGDCQGENQGVLCCLADHVGHLEKTCVATEERTHLSMRMMFVNCYVV